MRELAPHFLRAAGDRPIELHSHCTIGLAPLVYVEGLRAGFQVLHTAVGAARARDVEPRRPRRRCANLEAEGYSHRLDLEALAAMSEHFRELGREKGLPVGAPQEFDATYYHHQLAGGMVSTTRRMLEELRRPELFDAVLEEVGRVRAEMGYPIIVTPVSQLVATQAVRNVIDGERWANVSDETDPLLPRPLRRARRARRARRRRARALARRASRSCAARAACTSRARASASATRISDEELLLRLTMPEEQVDAMLAPAAARAPGRAGQPLPGRDAAARGRAARVGHAPARAEGRRPGRSGAVRLDDVRGVRLRRRRDARPPRGRRGSRPARARSRCWSGSAPPAGRSRSSRTAATSAPEAFAAEPARRSVSTSPTTSC